MGCSGSKSRHETVEARHANATVSKKSKTGFHSDVMSDHVPHLSLIHI